MTGWFDTPDTTPQRRRPFDELIAELAQRTGRPLWHVTRCQPTEASPGRIAKRKAEAA